MGGSGREWEGVGGSGRDRIEQVDSQGRTDVCQRWT